MCFFKIDITHLLNKIVKNTKINTEIVLPKRYILSLSAQLACWPTTTDKFNLTYL